MELGKKVWAPVSNLFKDNEVAVLDGMSFETPLAALICVLIQDLKRLLYREPVPLGRNTQCVVHEITAEVHECYERPP